MLERPALLEKAVASGLRSLFIGFETVNAANLGEQRKYQNLGRDYDAAIRRLHDLGVMVNGSFVFGMDGDGPDVFDRTVGWAVSQGIETATFHILTPYPDTALHDRMAAEHRIVHRDWDRYDTRHVVFRPAGMDARTLESGYRRAYQDFYRWGSIWARRPRPEHPLGQDPAPGLRWRMEEIRACLGPRHPVKASTARPPAARSCPHRLRSPQPAAHPAVQSCSGHSFSW